MVSSKHPNLRSTFPYLRDCFPGYYRLLAAAPAPERGPLGCQSLTEGDDDQRRRAAAAGAKLLIPLTDQFGGDRTAWVMDPSGHVWTIATRIEETTEDERQARIARIRAASSEPREGR